jgi:4-alpha-glucanotransferase
MLNSRASGILLHPTSLPSRFGIGDFGKAAYNFVDFLAENYQQIWQILPLGPTSNDRSPYSSYSSVAGNPLLIDLEQLVDERFLSKKDLLELPSFSVEKVDYQKVVASKIPLLELAYENFLIKATTSQQQKFEEFCARQSYWLNDYALFMAIKEFQPNVPWYEWERAIAFRHPNALQAWTSDYRNTTRYHKFLQFQFFGQWKNLKEYANSLGISIFGDVSFYVAHDSADVWANPHIFCLDSKGHAELMGGVPPDYFSDTGQLWGNPVYNWEKLAETNYTWWVGRIEEMLNQVDLLRIDHFRGLQAFWAVDREKKTAETGRWIEANGEDLFNILQEKLGILPIVAEDLGIITSEVELLRDKFHLSGMKVLQFAFDSEEGESNFLPHNYCSRNSVVYTGTHDNSTIFGWFKKRSPKDRANVIDYLGYDCQAENIHWSLIRLAMSSIANLAIFPLQDLLGLDDEARMNVPGTEAGNWRWRYRSEALTPKLGSRLKHLTNIYGRKPRAKNGS